jgi:ATP-dependent Lon protease
MRDYRDAKAMAQTLRDALKARSVSLTHSESLEIVARTLGFHDWNALSAAIQAGKPDDHPAPTAPAALNSHGAVLPIMALRDIVLFPQMVVPLFVGRDKTRRAIEYALAGDETLLVVTQRRSGDDDPTLDDLYPVGVTAKLVQRTRLDDGTLKIFVSGLQRARVVRLVEHEFLTAETAIIEDARGQTTDETSALSREIAETYQAHAKNFEPRSPIPASAPRPPAAFLGHFTQPGLLADTAAPLLQMLWSPGIDRMQQILANADVVTRLTMILELMKAAPPTKA